MGLSVQHRFSIGFGGSELFKSFGWQAVPKVLLTFATDELGSVSLGTKIAHVSRDA
ncbi:MAG: hypothetical protein ACI87E_003005 [Mariniblastus sp.]|jgi:hypothetical protein